MSRIIRVIDNETIEISDYRNSGYLFDHNAPTIEDVRKQLSNIDDWCCFKETINPFLLYGEKEELQQRIDKAIDYIERNCLEFNVKYACQGLNNDKVDVLLNILRGKNKPQYLGYSDKECINCGRLRVEKYSDGIEICEKCNFDQNKKEYV